MLNVDDDYQLISFIAVITAAHPSYIAILSVIKIRNKILKNNENTEFSQKLLTQLHIATDFFQKRFLIDVIFIFECFILCVSSCLLFACLFVFTVCCLCLFYCVMHAFVMQLVKDNLLTYMIIFGFVFYT